MSIELRPQFSAGSSAAQPPNQVPSFTSSSHAKPAAMHFPHANSRFKFGSEAASARLSPAIWTAFPLSFTPSRRRTILIYGRRNF